MTPTAPRRSPAEQARLEAALTELFEQRQRFNQHMGIRVSSLDRHGVTLAFDMRPELVGHDHYERLHGGVISATLDATGGAALLVCGAAAAASVPACAAARRASAARSCASAPLSAATA